MFGGPIFKLLLPFLKEMILGKSSFSYALRRNKLRLLFFFLVIGSFAANYFLVQRLVVISKNHVALTRQLKENEQLVQAAESDKKAHAQCEKDLLTLRETPLVPPPTVALECPITPVSNTLSDAQRRQYRERLKELQNPVE